MGRACRHCHIILTFSEEQEAEKIEIFEKERKEILYFHPACYVYFLRFISAIFKRIMQGLEMETAIEKFSCFYQAQNEIEKAIYEVLKKFKRHKIRVRAEKIYDLWILLVQYLKVSPNLDPRILKILEEVKKNHHPLLKLNNSFHHHPP